MHFPGITVFNQGGIDEGGLALLPERRKTVQKSGVPTEAVLVVHGGVLR